VAAADVLCLCLLPDSIKQAWLVVQRTHPCRPFMHVALYYNLVGSTLSCWTSDILMFS
jgi:hypothetical protein